MQILQTRVEQADPAGAPAEVNPLTVLTEDFERLNDEIRALYKAALPPAEIHQLCRGAREQAAIGSMILHDCTLRATNGTLTPAHMANAQKWIAGVRRWIESRQNAYAANVRRKFYVIKPRAGYCSNGISKRNANG